MGGTHISLLLLNSSSTTTHRQQCRQSRPLPCPPLWWRCQPASAPVLALGRPSAPPAGGPRGRGCSGLWPMRRRVVRGWLDGWMLSHRRRCGAGCTSHFGLPACLPTQPACPSPTAVSAASTTPSAPPPGFVPAVRPEDLPKGASRGPRSAPPPLPPATALLTSHLQLKHLPLQDTRVVASCVCAGRRRPHA